MAQHRLGPIIKQRVLYTNLDSQLYPPVKRDLNVILIHTCGPSSQRKDCFKDILKFQKRL